MADTATGHKKRRRSKKSKFIHKNTTEDASSCERNKNEADSMEMDDALEDVEYVIPELDLPPDSEFAAIFEMFKPRLDSSSISDNGIDIDGFEMDIDLQATTNSEDTPTNEIDPSKMSKKQLKKLCRMSVAQLKQLVKRPEVVEYEDTTAPDPLFLVCCKSIRNTVPVPPHWSAKRKYLAGKRGFLKPPFELPDYIKATGVTEQRNSLKEREESMSLKAKSREKMNPRMGKLNLDYEKLYDAFFKHQTKPPLTAIGDIYYEGKEYELRQKDKKPGMLSEELRSALGIPPLAPPPWLYNMQRFGPPPSYAYLKIPGLNAPIPEGAQWGFHPGGWGKPPVDEFNRPLYGDVFGLSLYNANAFDASEGVLQLHWGDPEPDEEPTLPEIDPSDLAQPPLPPPPPPEEEYLPTDDNLYYATKQMHDQSTEDLLEENEEDKPTVVHHSNAPNNVPLFSNISGYADEKKPLYTVISERPVDSSAPKSTFALSQKLYDVASLIKNSATQAETTPVASVDDVSEELSLEKKSAPIADDKKTTKPKKLFKF